MLMNRCKSYGLGYIDNSNIEVGYLAQDGLHLNEIGKSYLANNFINLGIFCDMRKPEKIILILRKTNL